MGPTSCERSLCVRNLSGASSEGRVAHSEACVNALLMLPARQLIPLTSETSPCFDSLLPSSVLLTFRGISCKLSILQASGCASPNIIDS